MRYNPVIGKSRLLAIIEKAGIHPKTGKPLCTPEIACPKCKRKRAPGHRINAGGDTEDKPDPCLGTLPGVVGACCGHGVNQGFICFEDGTIVYGYLRVTNIPPSWKKKNESA
jgi:hypothetical protein